MWQPLVRARRRLTGQEPVPAGPTGSNDGPAADLSFALGRADLERLIRGLAQLPGSEPGRPDTPARLETALRVAIDQAAGRGIPAVTRRPAGVYTPEVWHIEVAGADPRTRTTLERAIRGGGPA